MRFWLAAGMAIVSMAWAQNRMGGGGLPGGMHPTPPSFGIGIAGLRQFRVPQPLLNPFLYPTFPQRLANIVTGYPWDAPTYAGQPIPYPRFAGGIAAPFYSGSGYYGPSDFPGYGYAPPQPPPVVVVMPPPIPAPIPMPAPASAKTEEILPEPDAWQPPRMPVMALQQPAGAEESARESAPSGNHPALIAIRNGGLYSATTYWLRGTTFHFITTQGEHMQVPRSYLERVYPPLKNGRPEEPTPPAKR